MGQKMSSLKIEFDVWRARENTVIKPDLHKSKTSSEIWFVWLSIIRSTGLRPVSKVYTALKMM